MGKPSAPDPVDMVGAANATAANNKDAATFNANINKVDQYGPNGSKTYTLKPGADPKNPQPGDYIETTALNATQQGLYNTQAANNAAAQAGVSNALANPYQFTQYANPLGTFSATDAAMYVNNNGGSSLSNFTLPNQSVTAGQLQNVNMNTIPQLQGINASQLGQQTGVNTSQLQQLTGIDPSKLQQFAQFDPSQLQQLTGSVGKAGAMQTSVGNVGSVGTVKAAEKYNTDLLDTPEYQLKAAAEREVAAQAGKVRDTFDTSGVRQLAGTIDDTSRRRVEEALFARLNPMLAQEEASTRNQLLNAGMEIGTDGYNRELDRLSRSRNDARLATIAKAGEEESRQVLLNQGLQGQEFNQAYAKGQFGQGADVANNNAALAVSNANNNSALQYYNAENGMGMQANKFNFDQDIAAQNFRNQSIQGNMNNDIAVTGFNNKSQQQMFDQGLASANLFNSGTQANFNNDIAQLTANNTIKGLNNKNIFDAAQLNYNATLGNNNNVYGVNTANNNAAIGNNSNVFNANTSQNNAIGANNQTIFNTTAANNTATQGNITNSNNALGINNANVTQGLTNDIAAGNFANNAQIASWNATNAADTLNTNNVANAMNAMNQTAATQGNLNQQQFQQQAYLANLPFNQAAMVANNNPTQLPTFGQVPGQANTQGADLLNASIAQQNSNNQQYQTQMQGYNGIMSGLANIGAALI